jgi:ATP-dependent Lhr-like helicase
MKNQIIPPEPKNGGQVHAGSITVYDGGNTVHNDSSAGPFSRLAPFVREYIHEQKWKELRPIQEAAIEAVFDRQGHILIASGTASGKTEAAFFPVISLLYQKPAASVGVLYIGPLKALINDQFKRLSPLLERGNIPVWRWHGDVRSAHKKRLLEDPSGVLQITPESLEALLLRCPSKTGSLFRDLAFVIIDEVHAFMDSPRGAQLLCHLARIEEAAGCRPRRLGLSATLGDYGAARRWLCGELFPSDLPADKNHDGNPVILIKEEGTKKTIRIAVDCFDTPDLTYYEALYKQCRDFRNSRGKCIVFTNSRVEAEETAAALRALAFRRGEADVFHVHHGSIAGTLRAETEQDLKESEGPVVTTATGTLELGIDIGKLDRIIQIGPPGSAAAFVQRLGRSGRQSGKGEIYFSILDEGEGEEREEREEREENIKGGDIIDALPWNLIRTVAVVQLYLEEKWIEGAAPQPFPYSLLCHQTLSILASLGEQGPAELARRVLTLPPFAAIPPEDYRELLLRLIELEYVQKTEEGKLILGLEGEFLVNHYSFYTVFPDEAEYRVLRDGQELGTVNFLPAEGSTLALAGRYWQVRGFDVPRREIYVEGAAEGSKNVWRGSGAEIHTKIVQRMKQTLTEDALYPYLSGRAKDRLQAARSHARRQGICDGPFIQAGTNNDSLNGASSCFFIPWLGTRGIRTFQALFQNEAFRGRLGITYCRRKNDHVLSLGLKAPLPVFRETLGSALDAVLTELTGKSAAGPFTAPGLAAPGHIPLTEKYDYLMPPRLLAKQYAAHVLDLGEVKSFLRTR